MFILAILITTLAYAVFTLGIIHQITARNIITLCFVFLIFIFVKLRSRNFSLNLKKLGRLQLFTLILIFITFGVHLIGALGPELFYDALWYHLTLPKIYLAYQKVFFIPGNLYYYSAMPQLTEMLYVVALALGNEITAKLIHYTFAALTCVVIYKTGKKFLNQTIGLLAALIFATDLSVSWQATTAYIDLSRTFFEALAFYYFWGWSQIKKSADLYKIGLLIGMAISTKYLALGSLAIYYLLTFCFSQRSRFINSLKVIIPALLISSPWFIFAYLNTGNPVYPLFTPLLSSWHNVVIRTPINFISDFISLSNFPSDWITSISPIYLILIPVSLIFTFKKPIIKPVKWFCLAAYIVWFLTPRTGGSRFIIPYLPALSLLSISFLLVNLKAFHMVKKIALIAIFIIIFSNMVIRVYINKKYLPVIFGNQTKHDFLTENLDLTHAFYDLDQYFGAHIPDNQPVLIIGGQNLYYVDFPFIHETFPNQKETDYILTQYQTLPETYSNYNLIYSNSKTQVNLYQKPIGK